MCLPNVPRFHSQALLRSAAFAALLVPPAGIGKIPNMINGKVDAHHEVVSLFNEIDQRFSR